MPVWLDALKKDYLSPDGDRVAVIDVPGFKLNDAEHMALVGGSGTGKTTLLHLIAGILSPTSGRILFGKDPESADAPPPNSPGVLSYRTPGTGTPGIIDIT